MAFVGKAWTSTLRRFQELVASLALGYCPLYRAANPSPLSTQIVGPPGPLKGPSS